MAPKSFYWFFEVTKTDSDFSLSNIPTYEVRSTTQGGAMRLVRNIIRNNRWKSSVSSPRSAVRFAYHATSYDGTLEGILYLCLGDLDEPIPVLKVKRGYWTKKIEIEAIEETKKAA